tara:strand:- start:397 stop:1296 length:900 start_codon:yes stop_codon:yes gene_type:complete
MENYLYFAAADVNTGGAETNREGIMVPASKYIGADPVSTTTTKFMFESIEGLDEGLIQVTLTHGTSKNKQCIKAFMAAMNSSPSHGGLVVMADSDVAGTSKSSEYSPAFLGDVSTVAISDTKTGPYVQRVSGDGLISTATFGAPRMRKWIENGVVTTELRFDLTGLTAHGDTANDVIGIKAAAPNAYLIQYNRSTMGTIFKTEMICLETPAGAGTLNDISLAWNTSGTLGYTEAAGTTLGIDGSAAAWATGGYLSSGNQAEPTNDHYLYLTEGSTDGDDSVFTAGQFVVRLHGSMPLAS